MEWERDLAESNEGIGDVFVELGDVDKALAAYRDGLVIRKMLAQKVPGNVEWQTDLAISFDKVGSTGDAPEANLTEAIAILKRLETAGTLWPEKMGLIGDVEAALARLKPQ